MTEVIRTTTARGPGNGGGPVFRWAVWAAIALSLLLLFVPASALQRRRAPTVSLAAAGPATGLRAGAGAVNITPFTQEGHRASNPDPAWDGGITASGVWGESFIDANENGRWDRGEPFEDDPDNTALDRSARNVYNGIYLAGFGQNRMAEGAYDPVWTRAIVLEADGRRVAWVSIDLIGGFSHWADQVREALRQGHPAVRVDQIIITATHTHSGPDTSGMWGADEFTDGKYPKYVRYVMRRTAHAIAEAEARLEPVTVRFGAVTPAAHPDLEGMMSRHSCRTPWFFDDELRAMQLVGQSGTVATLVNWSAHAASLGPHSTHISSDWVHTLRTTVENAVGGVAFYVPGAQGAAEIVGNSCTQVWQREEFDGERFPVDPATGRPPFSLRRTHAIGRVLGKAALAALEAGSVDPTATGFTLDRRDVFLPVTNQGLRVLVILGVVDVPTYVAERWPLGYGFGTSIRTAVYHLRLGQGSFITAPGDVFPELYYGLDNHHRPGLDIAGTGRPFEPGVRPLQPGQYKFFAGYTADALGYIVPGYDFRIYGLPWVSGIHLGAIGGEAPDPLAAVPPDPAFPAALQGRHYHETRSFGSMAAPAVTCAQAELLGAGTAAEPACRAWARWNSALLRVHNPLTFLHAGGWVRHY